MKIKRIQVKNIGPYVNENYENERSVSCRTAMGLRARFASKEEEK